MSGGPFIVGSQIEVRPEELPRLLKTVAKRISGRTGIVERCFIPLGAREGDWTVRVQWLRSNGVSTMGPPDYWNARQLRMKEAA